jgi:hypothetical protein
VQLLIQPSTVRAAGSPASKGTVRAAGDPATLIGDPVYGQPTVRAAQSPAAFTVKWPWLLLSPFEVVPDAHGRVLLFHERHGTDTTSSTTTAMECVNSSKPEEEEVQ